jgi:hypothetical protein
VAQLVGQRTGRSKALRGMARVVPRFCFRVPIDFEM